MVSQEDFRHLIQTIVATEIPDEEFMFDVEGDAIIADLFSGHPLQHNTSSAEFRGVDSRNAPQVIQYVTVFNTTFALLRSTLPALKGNRPMASADLARVLAPRWYNELTAAGLDPKMARVIAERFASDIATLADRL